MGQFAESFGIIGVYIGVAGFIVCQILHFGTSKAERYGKVQTDPKTAKRIKIGYYFGSLVVILPILGIIIGSIVDKLMR